MRSAARAGTRVLSRPKPHRLCACAQCLVVTTRRAFSVSNTPKPPGLKSGPKIPVLSKADVIKKMEEIVPPKQKQTILALYSSLYGGITTDVSMMNIPFFERGWHRGHAVFDTASVVNSKCFGIDFHTTRFLASAAASRIPVPWSRQDIKNIVLQTVAASRARDDAMVRMYMTGGTDTFGIAPPLPGTGDYGPSCCLYVAVVAYKKETGSGIAECLVDPKLPLKPPLLANTKSVNYLLNTLVAMDARDKGGTLGVQVDDRGYLTESAVASIAIVTKDKKFLTPRFEKILRGTTVVRAMELAREHLVPRGLLTEVGETDIPLSAVMEAAEMIQLGGSYMLPIVRFEGHAVGGHGRPGPVFSALDSLLREDMASGPYVDEVPYSD